MELEAAALAPRAVDLAQRDADDAVRLQLELHGGRGRGDREGGVGAVPRRSRSRAEPRLPPARPLLTPLLRAAD